MWTENSMAPIPPFGSAPLSDDLHMLRRCDGALGPQRADAVFQYLHNEGTGYLTFLENGSIPFKSMI